MQGCLLTYLLQFMFSTNNPQGFSILVIFNKFSLQNGPFSLEFNSIGVWELFNVFKNPFSIRGHCSSSYTIRGFYTFGCRVCLWHICQYNCSLHPELQNKAHALNYFVERTCRPSCLRSSNIRNHTAISPGLFLAQHFYYIRSSCI